MITALSINPNIGNIKNDFSIWGTRKSISGTDIPVHLRFAIDKKPKEYITYDGIKYVASDKYEVKDYNNDFSTVYIDNIEKFNYYNLGLRIFNEGLEKYSNNQSSSIDEKIVNINSYIMGSNKFYYYSDKNLDSIICPMAKENAEEIVLDFDLFGIKYP
jgi:hypothetical protein